MQPLSNVIPGRRQLESQKQTAGTTPAKPDPVKPPARALRRLWEAMTGIYGEKWPRAYGESPQDDDGALTATGKAWGTGLAGIDMAGIGRALEACMVSASPWVPTLPEFRALCFSIPSLAAVQLEYRGLAERTRFGMGVWQLIDADRWRMAGPEKRDALLAAAYDLTREHVIRGGDLPELPVACVEAPPPPAPKPPDPAKREAAIREACDALGVRRVTGKDAASGERDPEDGELPVIQPPVDPAGESE